ncbi:response regulator [Phormidium tenue FACHB-886]|nr:response regulator [Phormidium tenue FACHB-886]
MTSIVIEDGALPLDGLRVLVVDGNADSRELLEFVFEQNGAEVLTAGCCDSAIELLRRSDVHLLLSELQLPEKDGYTLIAQVRALEPQQTEQIPAIAVSGYANREDRDRAISAGYQKHFAKPVDIHEVVGWVAKRLQSAK